jgi:hypothetical protein
MGAALLVIAEHVMPAYAAQAQITAVIPLQIDTMVATKS